MCRGEGKKGGKNVEGGVGPKKERAGRKCRRRIWVRGIEGEEEEE